MKKLATIAIIAAVFAVVACQTPQQGAAVTPEQLEAVKTELSALKTEVENLTVIIDSLNANYSAHLDKYHKGAPKPPSGGNGGGVKPPTIK